MRLKEKGNADDNINQSDDSESDNEELNLDENGRVVAVKQITILNHKYFRHRIC